MKKTVGKQFGAYVKVTLDLYVPVGGKTLEEAIAEARTLKVTDLVDVPTGTDLNDWEIELHGVHQR